MLLGKEEVDGDLSYLENTVKHENPPTWKTFIQRKPFYQYHLISFKPGCDMHQQQSAKRFQTEISSFYTAKCTLDKHPLKGHGSPVNGTCSPSQLAGPRSVIAN